MRGGGGGAFPTRASYRNFEHQVRIYFITLARHSFSCTAKLLAFASPSHRQLRGPSMSSVAPIRSGKVHRGNQRLRAPSVL